MKSRQFTPAIALLFLLIALTAFCFPRYAAAETPPNGMFDLYEMNRQEGVPNYITEDFLLLAHAMTIQQAITDLETRVLIPAFADIVAGVSNGLAQQDKTDPSVQLARNFIAVIDCLLSGADQPEPGKAHNPDIVAAELSRVRSGAGVAKSDLMGQTIDYSQFIVRGKYSQTQELGRYFQAMKYAGTVLFPVTATKATGVTPEAADLATQTALRIVETFYADPGLLAKRNQMAIRLTWIFGPPDNLTHVDYYTVGREAGNTPVSVIRQKLLEQAKSTGRRPLVLSGVVITEGLEKGVTARDALTGWQFIPQRYTPDSAAFQQLVYDKVTVYQGDQTPFSLSIIQGKPVKGFPLGLELMALMGSDAAAKQLAASDNQNYKGYTGAQVKAKMLIDSGMDIPTLMSSHLALAGNWLKETQKNGPDPDRRLNTALSFWTWNRYITLLYAKQSYTLVGKSLNIDLPPRQTAWIEPAPELYSSLAATADSVKTGFIGDTGEAKALEPIVQRLSDLEAMMRRCRKIAAEVAQNGALIYGEDAAFLNNLDKSLLSLTGKKDAPIVTDVHTEPASGMVLQEAIGPPGITTRTIGEQEVRGALFQYYEFKHPMDQRMTDEAWRKILSSPGGIKDLTLSPGSSKSIP